MNTKLVALRLSEDMIRAIEAEAAATGQSKTAIVIEALKQYLNLSVIPPLANSSLEPQPWFNPLNVTTEML